MLRNGIFVIVKRDKAIFLFLGQGVANFEQKVTLYYILDFIWSLYNEELGPDGQSATADWIYSMDPCIFNISLPCEKFKSM